MRRLRRLRQQLKTLHDQVDRQAEARLLDGQVINELCLRYEADGTLPENDLQRARVLEIARMIEAMRESVPKCTPDERVQDGN